MLRLRQICLVAPELEPAVATLCETLGITVAHRDPSVAPYGLVNAVMPVGHSFLEVVAPVRDDAAAARYLARRGGAGGYMVILDCADIAGWEQEVAARGVRIANRIDHGEAYHGLQLHPRDTGGAMIEINWTQAGAARDGAYHPAGPDWQGAVRTGSVRDIAAVEIQGDDPEALARRWGAILDRPVEHRDGGAVIALDHGAIRFVAASDGRGEGLAAVDLIAANKPAILRRAAAAGCAVDGDTVTACGIRIHFL